MLLSDKISIYIPSTVAVDNTADTSSVLDEAMTLFSELFGGVTVYKALGGWMSREKGLVKEEIHIVSSFSMELSTSDINIVKQFAQEIKEELKQEAVSIEVNGELLFI